jgi:hypothetical protein
MFVATLKKKSISLDQVPVSYIVKYDSFYITFRKKAGTRENKN